MKKNFQDVRFPDKTQAARARLVEELFKEPDAYSDQHVLEYVMGASRWHLKLHYSVEGDCYMLLEGEVTGQVCMGCIKSGTMDEIIEVGINFYILNG